MWFSHFIYLKLDPKRWKKCLSFSFNGFLCGDCLYTAQNLYCHSLHNYFNNLNQSFKVYIHYTLQIRQLRNELLGRLLRLIRKNYSCTTFTLLVEKFILRVLKLFSITILIHLVSVWFNEKEKSKAGFFLLVNDVRLEHCWNWFMHLMSILIYRLPSTLFRNIFLCFLVASSEAWSYKLALVPPKLFNLNTRNCKLGVLLKFFFMNKSGKLFSIVKATTTT